jgi:hypothetical protein
MTNTFWLNDPTILFNKEYITELWPTGKMTLAAKLNAITRIVILLSILGYLVTRSFKIPISAIVTIVILIIIYKTQKKKKLKEAYGNISMQGEIIREQLESNAQGPFTQPNPANPLMNVLLPEIKDNPTRKAAAPSFNPVVEKEINNSAGNVGIDPRLFVDLGDKLSFENSMRQFYPTANTRVPNDQTAFAEFCYGNMPSCKEGDGLQCIKDNPRWINY